MNVNDGRIKSVVFEALGRRTDVEENQRAYGAVDHRLCADDAGGRVCRRESDCKHSMHCLDDPGYIPDLPRERTKKEITSQRRPKHRGYFHPQIAYCHLWIFYHDGR